MDKQIHKAIKTLNKIGDAIQGIREIGFDVENLSKKLRNAELEILLAIDSMKGKEEEDRGKTKIMKREM